MNIRQILCDYIDYRYREIILPAYKNAYQPNYNPELTSLHTYTEMSNTNVIQKIWKNRGKESILPSHHDYSTALSGPDQPITFGEISSLLHCCPDNYKIADIIQEAGTNS